MNTRLDDMKFKSKLRFSIALQHWYADSINRHAYRVIFPEHVAKEVINKIENHKLECLFEVANRYECLFIKSLSCADIANNNYNYIFWYAND